VALAEMSTVVRKLSRRCESDYRIAITKKGAMTFMVFAGKFNVPVFVNFMYRLLNQIEGNVYLIVDGNPRTNGLSKSRARDKVVIVATVRSHLYRRQKPPQVIKTYFSKNRFVMPLEKLCAIYRPTHCLSGFPLPRYSAFQFIRLYRIFETFQFVSAAF
jgi:hypothetical protein